MTLRRLLPLLVLAAVANAQTATARKKLLVIGDEKGYRHEAISHAMVTIERLGRESGLWDTHIRTDTEPLTKKKLEFNAKNLNDFDAVLFYTGGTLAMDDQQKADFLSFVRDDGKGFIGVHSATITFTKWPEYGDMLGGYFDEHPWGTFDAPILVEDASFPGMKAFPAAFTLNDEIYQMKLFSREKTRVLMRLDASKLDLANPRVHRADRDFAVTWAKLTARVGSSIPPSAMSPPTGTGPTSRPCSSKGSSGRSASCLATPPPGQYPQPKANRDNDTTNLLPDRGRRSPRRFPGRCRPAAQTRDRLLHLSQPLRR